MAAIEPLRGHQNPDHKSRPHPQHEELGLVIRHGHKRGIPSELRPHRFQIRRVWRFHSSLEIWITHCFLKICAQHVLSADPKVQKNLERVLICIGFVERRIVLMSEAIFEVNQTIIIPGQNNDLDVINDDVYYYILDGKAFFKDFTKASWYIKL